MPSISPAPLSPAPSSVYPPSPVYPPPSSVYPPPSSVYPPPSSVYPPPSSVYPPSPVYPPPSSVYPPSPAYAPSSIYPSRSPSPSLLSRLPSTSSQSSYQAAAIRLRQKHNLGYTPFEYWKGPKPVLPGQKRLPIPHKRLSASQPPRRAATVATTAAHRPRPRPAQRQIRPASTLSLYPLEKVGVDVNHLDHPALRGGASTYNIMGWSRGSARTAADPASFQVRQPNGSTVELVTGHPPPYSAPRMPRTPTANNGQPWWDPRTWSKRIWATIVAVVIIAIIVGVVAGVLVAKANRYPDYTKLTYKLHDTYSGTSFFDKFDYYEGYDPTSGFVHYVPKARAQQLNLTYATSSSAVLKVDTSVGNTSNPDASTGRFSVRVSSKTQYDSGLFVFDVKHTPYGCGTWPALWLTDASNWPDNGEMDVMEAVNLADTGNQMTLHTSSGCKMNVKRKMTGTSTQSDCNEATNDNAGCGVKTDADGYGSAFNSAGGGVMALEWRSEGIRMWQFDRDSVPSDLSTSNSSAVPDPSSWGEATADFPNTDCSISSHFRNQSIIANIDLCGDWAGNVYADSGCPSSCTDYVANYPQAFTNAYWEFGEFRVYKAT